MKIISFPVPWRNYTFPLRAFEILFISDINYGIAYLKVMLLKDYWGRELKFAQYKY